MPVKIREINDIKIAVIESAEIVFGDAQAALDTMAECGYQDAFKIIIRKENINPEFFNLKSGLAGDILQKFSNYNTQLAIVGDFSDASPSLADFIFESNKSSRVNFVSSIETAIEKLLKN